MRQPGQIGLLEFPKTDLTPGKRRPVLPNACRGRPKHCGLVPLCLSPAQVHRCPATHSGNADLPRGNWGAYLPAMSTVGEIQAALPHLTVEELRSVDAALREQFRARKLGILYDDAYGLWTEEDQASVAAEGFALLDQEEEREHS
jgi:hypothetical protein